MPGRPWLPAGFSSCPAGCAGEYETGRVESSTRPVLQLQGGEIKLNRNDG